MMLKTRIVTAVVLVPLVLAAMFGLGTRGWALVTIAIVAIAAGEWARLADFGQLGSSLYVAGTLAIGAGLLLAGGFSVEQGWPETLVTVLCGGAMLFWLVVAPLWLWFGWRAESRLALALLGWLLLIATWVAVVQVHAKGPGLLLALMAIVWVADTAAYFTGRRFGRHKLAPSISPGKTWEGVFGAMFAVSIYALALLVFVPHEDGVHVATPGTAVAWIAMVLLLAALSIIGDLFE